MTSERNITDEVENSKVSGESVQSENSDQQKEEKEQVTEPKEPLGENSVETPEEVPENSSPPVEDNSTPADSTEAETPAEENHSEDHHDHEDEEDHDHEEDLNYDKLDKPELLKHIEELKDWSNTLAADKRANLLKLRLDEIIDEEKKEALEKFLEEGGEEGDFDFIYDQETAKFEATYRYLKDKKRKHLKELEATRESNLEKAQHTLERLREFVDSDESSTSFNAFKELQQEWRSIGPLPRNQVKSLWANYNALVNLFYDHRSIYFELKELDRKKNLEAKLELCVKAEALAKEGDLKKAIVELNDLHDEFKHIGPVPIEEQEALWTRFKAASDEIYARRKEFYHNLKSVQKENLAAKEALIGELKAFVEFSSNSIKEWNSKTKEIVKCQKKWEEIGGVPKEQSKEINKQFWSSFKEFFKNKNKFFKGLESLREENLQSKQDLIKKVESLINEKDVEKAANEIKDLQRKWRDIGPVPEKKRQEIFKEFKALCDQFFQHRREAQKELVKQYEDNLEKKKELIGQIKKLGESDSSNLPKLEELKSSFEQIGFVPRNAINSIQKEFSKAVEEFLNGAEIDESKKEEILIEAELSQLKSNPNSGKKLQQKEYSLRKRINQIEDEVNRMKTNLDFFADSKQAQILKDQFNEKISSATEELMKLKKQLKVLRAAKYGN